MNYGDLSYLQLKSRRREMPSSQFSQSVGPKKRRKRFGGLPLAQCGKALPYHVRLCLTDQLSRLRCYAA